MSAGCSAWSARSGASALDFCGTFSPVAPSAVSVRADAASEAHFGVGARFWDSDGASDAESEATPYAERALRDLRDRRPRPTPRLVLHTRARLVAPLEPIRHIDAVGRRVVGALRVMGIRSSSRTADERRPVERLTHGRTVARVARASAPTRCGARGGAVTHQSYGAT